MSLAQLALVALVQGLTEWLPVSSSAHLILISALTPMNDQGVAIDTLAHGGTLAAMIVYFRADCATTISGIRRLAQQQYQHHETRLAMFLIVASPPALIAGAALEASQMTSLLRTPQVIAITTIGFGLLLWAADTLAPARRHSESVSLRDAALMGLAQTLALIPGTSRSGIMITAARMCGFKRVDAARLAMLAGGPVLAAAAGYGAIRIVASGNNSASLVEGITVCALSFVSGLASIWALMALLRRISYLPFAIYRLGLGAGLLLLAPGGNTLL